MADLGYGRMAAIMWPSDRAEIDHLRAEYAARLAEDEQRNSHLSLQYALDAAAEYIEALERWVMPGE